VGALFSIPCFSLMATFKGSFSSERNQSIFYIILCG
jgi:hypothetical protein